MNGSFASNNLALGPFAAESGEGELLYNGIRLGKNWPPRDIDSASRAVRAVPYLQVRPGVVPIDVGRQLLVDDFAIADHANVINNVCQAVDGIGK